MFVVDHRGGAPDLVLQRIDLSDEAVPFKIVRETIVRHAALDHIETARWGEDGLTFTEDDKTWFVRATSDAFEAQAIKDS